MYQKEDGGFQEREREREGVRKREGEEEQERADNGIFTSKWESLRAQP